MLSIQVWHLTPQGAQPVDLPDQSSMDVVTRQLPEGYYSTFRTYMGGTRVLGLRRHLRRLYEPVSGPRVDAAALRRHLRALLEAYRHAEARVRLVMTREGVLYVALEPLRALPRAVYEEGVRVETTELHRLHPRLKSTSFIGRSDAERKHLAQEGVFEALLVKDGRILEGMTSNFFYVERVSNSLYTARSDILLGVTRQTVLALARGRGLKVMYRALQRDQLPAAREAFLTSSSRGIVPIIQIDDVTIGEGSPGPVTRELMPAYEAYVLEKAEPI